MKIENGLENAENYSLNLVGDSSQWGRTKIVKRGGGASSYPPLILLEGGGGVCLNENFRCYLMIKKKRF